MRVEHARITGGADRGEHAGRTRDVGEEERDGAGRQISAHQRERSAIGAGEKACAVTMRSRIQMVSATPKPALVIW